MRHRPLDSEAAMVAAPEAMAPGASGGAGAFTAVLMSSEILS